MERYLNNLATPTHALAHRVSTEDVSGQSQGEIPCQMCVVTCHMSCSLVAGWEACEEAVFPLPQQRKLQDRSSFVLFFQDGHWYDCHEVEVRLTQTVTHGHVISPNKWFLCPLWYSLLFQEQLFTALMNGVIHLAGEWVNECSDASWGWCHQFEPHSDV